MWTSADIRAFPLLFTDSLKTRADQGGEKAQHLWNPIAVAFGGRKQGRGKRRKGEEKGMDISADGLCWVPWVVANKAEELWSAPPYAYHTFH